MNQIATSSASAFASAMTADVNVGMNEVVSVFVSKYEDGLFAKKDELSKLIKTAKSEMADLVASLERSVNKDQYNTVISLMELKTKVTGLEVVWNNVHYSRKEENSIHIVVGVFDMTSDRDYPSFSKSFVVPISKENVKLYNSMKDNLESLNGELLEVMSSIKAVSRKERQIRGRISEMKLEQSGFGDLLNNPEMLKLISVE